MTRTFSLEIDRKARSRRAGEDPLALAFFCIVVYKVPQVRVSPTTIQGMVLSTSQELREKKRLRKYVATENAHESQVQ